MNLKPIKKKRVSQMIIERIKDSVESGVLSPGDKLPSERELSALLSVSRSAVREALSVLEAEGMLEIRPGVGVFLAKNPREEIVARLNEIFHEDDLPLVELLELRQALESEAAALAAERRSNEDLRRIEEALRELESAVERGEVAAEEDFQFHMAVVKASGNSMMARTLRLISDAFLKGLYKSRSHSLTVPGKTRLVLEEHREIYRAIEQRNPERARQALLRHLENVKKRYI
ncbi:FadR/GntR family transcriptional regulator [Bacillaceae bacterium]